jgi:ABC-type dipeptide/oligopeptide/nickel transport system ATPase component
MSAPAIDVLNLRTHIVTRWGTIAADGVSFAVAEGETLGRAAARTARPPGGDHPEREIPSPLDPPPGCGFHTRSPHVMDRCRAHEPPLAPEGGRRRAGRLYPLTTPAIRG